eukprot:4237003-Pleurochrysis_carterae.AAC.2
MMTLRSGKNRRGAARGFVKKSARLSALFTKGAVISRDSTFPQTKKCLRSICFDRAWCSGLYARSIVDLLSNASDVGSVAGDPSSATSDRK